MTKLVFVMALTFISSQALAASKFSCDGSQNDTKLSIKGEMPKKSIAGLSKAAGTISVNGREVAKFQAGDLKTNLLKRSFKVRTNHGEVLDGKVTDMGDLKARVDLSVPAFGVELTNFPVQCKI